MEHFYLLIGKTERILAENVDSVSDMCQETAFGICLSRINFPKGYIENKIFQIYGFYL